MKKNLILALIVAIGLSVITGYSVKQSNDINKFNFVYRYGIEGQPKNIIDTFKSIYTKDTVQGSKTIRLLLTDEEMEQIYNEMNTIDIFNIDGKFTKRFHAEPNGTYYLKVIMNGKEKTLYWSTENFDPTLCKVDDDKSSKSIDKDSSAEKDQNAITTVKVNFGKFTFCRNNEPGLVELSKLGRLIEEIIYKKDGVKKLPPSPLYE